MSIMASRIANVALPSGGYDIFGKLRERAFKKYGNYGGANDPRNRIMPADQYLSGNLPTLPSTQSMDEIHKKNTFNTRAETAQREFGMASMSMAPLMQGGAPRQGQASSYIGTQPSYATSGGQRAGDPRVEDSGWGQTLAQIVGSGMLTQAQLQSASYANVSSMLRVDGGSAADKQEMTYMLQRYILEGYVRGVDMVRDIKEDYGGSVRIQLTDGAVCGTTSTSIIGCGGMGYTQFRNSFWQNAGDATKLALFYHEVGHEMLNRGHAFGQQSLMSYDYFNNSWAKNGTLYKSLMDELYRNASGVSRFSPTGGATRDQINQWLANENLPPGNGPVGSPPGTPPSTTTTTNTQTTSFSYGPGGIGTNSSYLGSPTQVGGNAASSPDDADKTPVAGMLPDMASTQSFAAGLADTLNRAAPTLQGLSGALMRFKTG